MVTEPCCPTAAKARVLPTAKVIPALRRSDSDKGIEPPAALCHAAVHRDDALILVQYVPDISTNEMS